MHGFLDVAVPHELPARLSRSFGDSPIRKANRGIDCQCGFDLVLVEDGLQTPESHAHSIFKPGEVRDVRNDLSSARRWQHRARHRPLDIPLLYIDDNPYYHASGPRKTK